METLQANRYLYLDLTKSLGPDKLLLSQFTGYEALNQLFQFELHLLAENATTIDFDKLIGQNVSFGVKGTDDSLEPRNFDGIVTEFSQGARDSEFTQYTMKIVPEVWKLTRQVRSRIFQHIKIPDLLKQLFEGFDVAQELGDYEPREYITQYQESDFAFASRLMEEEGIYYFFRFTQGAHKLVLADTPQSHSDIPGDPKVIFEANESGVRDEERIGEWRKEQIWDSGKYTLWDHNFQKPHKHLEAEKIVIDKVQVGKVSHKLKLAGNENLEVLEQPGRYALRFDGINKNAGEQPDELGKIFQDNKRTTELRMELVESRMIEIKGAGNCRQLTAGHKFTLQRHFSGDGKYLIKAVQHHAREGSFRSDDEKDTENYYGNTFSAQPFELPYRPARTTPRPVIAGPLSAVVVGLTDEGIFTDKYGRVKVKFMWDPMPDTTDTSCWMRVATSWAGQNWGSIHIPRVGQEVIVSFTGGDPDAPLVTGSVYNPDQMPPYVLPGNATVSTIKSRSHPNGTKDNYNELRFEDMTLYEQVFLRAERDKDERVKAESREFVGRNRHLIVEGSQFEHTGGNKNSTVGGDYRVKVKGKQELHVTGETHEKHQLDFHQEMMSDSITFVAGDVALEVYESVQEHIVGNHSRELETGSTYRKNDAGHNLLECPAGIAGTTAMIVSINGSGGISLAVGASCILMTPTSISISSPMVLINSGPAKAFPVPPIPPIQTRPHEPPKDPDGPDTADDGTKFDKL